MSTITAPRKRPAGTTSLDDPRVRFNWGFWDALANKARGNGRPDGCDETTIVGRHFDPFYAHGYVAGAKAHAAGEGPRLRASGTSSEPAWQGFLAEITDNALLAQAGTFGHC